MTLSICMIVKNEEKNIARAINSVLPIADEIIVVDTGSTDNTVQIVRDMIGRVYFTPWVDDFAHARNKSIALATKDLVMWIDADDVIPESTYKYIEDIKNNVDGNSFYSATIHCTDVADIKYVVKPVFEQSRIFPNHKGIIFENKIHETFTNSAISKGLKIVKSSDFIIEHKGYGNSVDLEKKRRRNIRIIMSCLGFPSNIDYYEFDYLDCLCVYTPNVVVAWRGIEYMGAADVEKSEYMEASIKLSVDKILKDYNDKHSNNFMERFKNIIDKLEYNGLITNV